MLIERIAQALVSMQSIARNDIDEELLNEIKPSLSNFTTQAVQVLLALITVLNLQTLNEGVSPLQDELDQLDKTAQRILPNSLAVLDVSRDSFLLRLWSKYRDIQDALLRLGLSLRGQVIKSNLLPAP